MEEAAQVFSEPEDRSQRLYELGLDEGILLDAVMYGQRFALECTLNDPRTLAGIEAWGKTVRYLRERLVPLGWERDDRHNYPTVVHPSTSFALAACGGNSNTGLPDRTPSTRSDKGPITKGAVLDNQMSFADYYSAFKDEFDKPRRTWLLLYHRDEETRETRVELALPSGITDRGFVCSWRERIVLSPIPFVPLALPDEESQDIEIDVSVERKQG